MPFSLRNSVWWKSAFVAAVQCPCYLLMEGERKERSEWACIVLCSRQFMHTHTHSLLLYKEINALSFPLCAQHLTVPQASCDQTPHRVLQLLILKLTQWGFCTLVLQFIYIVFSCNKRCCFWWLFLLYFLFFVVGNGFIHFLMVTMVFFPHTYFLFLITILPYLLSGHIPVFHINFIFC